MAWLEGFSNRIKLVIPPDNVDNTLTDFPVLLHLSSSSGRTGYDATAVFDELTTANRKKIAITTTTTTGIQCPVEIEYWDSTEEKAFLWTKVPTIYSSIDTELYLYYDATTSGNTTYVGDVGETPAQQVWDNNYVAVWHMSQDPSGGAGAIKNSTSNLNHGTSAGSMGTGDLVDGNTGKALDFDGSDDHIDCGSNSSLLGMTQITLEVTAKPTSWPAQGPGLVDYWYDGSTNSVYAFGVTTNSMTLYLATTGGAYQAAGSLGAGGVLTNPLGEWGYFVASWDGSYMYLHKNGSHITNKSFSQANLATSSSQTFKIASEPDPTGWDRWTGAIDEVRISNIGRSSAWIKATYHSNWDNFVVFQDEDIATGWLTGSSYWAKRMELAIDNTDIDYTLVNFPLAVTLASGTNAAGVFDELATPVSGTVDSYTKLLLHGTGDVSSFSHTIISHGNPSIYSNTVSGSSFPGSFYFDGSNDYLSVANHADWYFGSGDFTIDFWIKFDPTISNEYVLSYWTGSGDQRSWWCGTDGTGKFQGKVDPDGTDVSTAVLIGTTTALPGVWYHYAFLRDGSTLRLFVNGVQEDSDTAVGAFNSSAELEIAALNAGDIGFAGCISELRISKGIARWTSNFTPQTTPYEIDSYTKLLIHCEGDKSSSEHNVILDGSTKLSTVQSKFNGGSFYFDGTNDYLTIPDHTDWAFGTNDFTIEGWVMLTNASQTDFCLFAQYVDSSNWTQFYRRDVNDTIYFISRQGGSNLAYYTVVTTPQINKWQHFALVRNGTSIYIFIDGVSQTLTVGPPIGGNSLPNWAVDVHIGYDDNNSQYTEGYMDEIRISKGIARYTSDFEPQNQPHPVDEYPSNEKKIAITTSDGLTQCPVEIERWDWVNSEINLWTKVPIVYPDENTVLYLYYDRTKADNTTYVGDTGDVVAQTVWDSNYVGVWHMAQNPYGPMLDSTSNTKHGSSAGDMLLENLVNGKIGKGVDFDGSDDYITFGDQIEHDGFTQGMTSSIIFKRNVASSIHVLLAKYDSGTNNRSHKLSFRAANSLEFAVSKDGTSDSSNYHDVITTSTFTDTTEFHKIDGVWVPNVDNKIYYDGIYQSATPTYTSRSSIHAGSANFYIATDQVPGSYEANGIIDEVRLSDIGRSAAWLKADYYSCWDSILTYGAEEIPPVSPICYYYGYVMENTVTPAARVVRLYLRSTGELMDETTSQASDGYYYLTTTVSGEHFIVCFDDDAGLDYNALVLDRLPPRGIE